MNCPVCETPLRVIHKFGAEIDICPGCKGVWLDRGELEKIIEMEAVGGPPQEYTSEPRATSRPRETPARYRDDDDQKYRRPQSDQHGRPQKKKRESWFGEIFEIFGD